MSVSLSKNERVALSKDNSVTKVKVCLGWETAKYDDDGDFDLDSSCFAIQRNGMTRCDEDFVFYGNLKHPSGAITHAGDDLVGGGNKDNEVVSVDLSKVPKYVDKIVFTTTIFEAERRMQNFGMVNKSFIRVVDDVTGKEILRYDLKETFSSETAVIIGEIYKDGSGWKFKAIGEGFEGGLAKICEKFGIEVK